MSRCQKLERRVSLEEVDVKLNNNSTMLWSVFVPYFFNLWIFEWRSVICQCHCREQELSCCTINLSFCLPACFSTKRKTFGGFGTVVLPRLGFCCVSTQQALSSLVALMLFQIPMFLEIFNHLISLCTKFFLCTNTFFSSFV